jgi:hypothetical protein
MLKKVQQEASALARDKRSLQTTADSALAEVKAIREARDKLEALCRLLQKSNKEAAVRLAREMARCLQKARSCCCHVAQGTHARSWLDKAVWCPHSVSQSLLLLIEAIRVQAHPRRRPLATELAG